MDVVDDGGVVAGCVAALEAVATTSSARVHPAVMITPRVAATTVFDTSICGMPGRIT